MTPDLPPARQLSPSLFLIEDICNVYLIRRGERAIAIDSGSGLGVEALAGLGVRQVEWVVHTHFHRDQNEGAGLFRAAGARIAAPRAEIGYFAGASDFWRGRGIFDNYTTYNDFFAPTVDCAVDLALVDYQEFFWADLTLQILPAPGHTKGGIMLAGEIDGQRVVFCGDVIHHSGRPWTLYDLEWTYGQQTGVPALAHTLQTLADLAPHLALPSHGAPLPEPAAACASLIGRLSAYYQWLQLNRYPSAPGYALLPPDSRVQPLTPHLWANTTSVANSYTLLADDGTAMQLDYGFPSSSHFAANFRFAAHSLAELRRVAGLRSIEVVLPSHYHDDHVCGLQWLYEQHGAALWVFENQVDILAHPEAYKIPCLWERPMIAAKVFGEGEAFAWRGISFQATKLPGHTEYHCGLRFEIDGRRIAYVGDTLARALTGPRFGGPVFQNRFLPGDFVETVTKIRDFEPEWLLTGHFGTVLVEPAFLDEALRRARALEEIIWGLVAVPAEAGFALDPNWATLYPYQATVMAGGTARIEVRIVNHLNHPATPRATLRLPAGWIAVEADAADPIDAGGQGTLTFDVTAPAGVTAGERNVITADIALGDRRFGPVAEGIIRVTAAAVP
ncbi:MAG: MBL fold metallo-hydrolase [Chloroflexi bacterium]|nr:MBL fold metallo-hydrolase [Chloroflexota bacterium]